MHVKLEYEYLHKDYPYQGAWVDWKVHKEVGQVVTHLEEMYSFLLLNCATPRNQDSEL